MKNKNVITVIVAFVLIMAFQNCDQYEFKNVVLPSTVTDDDIEFSWQVTSWGECSNECGEGQQTRDAFCLNSTTGIAVGDQNCLLSGEKPKLSQVCVQRKPSCDEAVIGPFSWKTTAWSGCDRLCGEGRESRQVYCYDDGLKKQVADTNCLTQKPSLTKACVIEDSTCEVWIQNPQDFLNLKNSTFRKACLRRNINFNQQIIGANHLTNLVNQTFEGCGQNLSNLKFTSRGLFERVSNKSVIQNLNIVAPTVDVNLKNEFAQYFGLISNVVSDATLRNISITNFTNASVKGPGFGSDCGVVAGTANGLTANNINIQGESINLSCYESAGFIARVFPSSTIAKISNVNVNIRNLNFTGANLAGGVVGRFFGIKPLLIDEMRNLNFNGKIISDTTPESKSPVIGGILGQTFMAAGEGNADYSPTFNNWNFLGEFDLKNTNCEYSSATTGGLVGHHFPNEDNTKVVKIKNSVFAGDIKIQDCERNLNTLNNLNFGLGLGFSRAPSSTIEFENVTTLLGQIILNNSKVYTRVKGPTPK